MTSNSYWVTLKCENRELGAGFFISPHWILTAAHCLAPIADDARIDVLRKGGHALWGRILLRRRTMDLALVELGTNQESNVLPPLPSICENGDEWHSWYRPTPADPSLSGIVQDADCAYECEGGNLIEALQLKVAAELGDYSGYSGAPVERVESGDRQAVLGVLLEQYPERGGADRASNIVFAASMRTVFDAFPQCDPLRLYEVIADDSIEANEPASTTNLAETERYLQRFKRWYESGLIDDEQWQRSRENVLRKLIDGEPS